MVAPLSKKLLFNATITLTNPSSLHPRAILRGWRRVEAILLIRPHRGRRKRAGPSVRWGQRHTRPACSSSAPGDPRRACARACQSRWGMPPGGGLRLACTAPVLPVLPVLSAALRRSPRRQKSAGGLDHSTVRPGQNHALQSGRSGGVWRHLTTSLARSGPRSRRKELPSECRAVVQPGGEVG